MTKFWTFRVKFSVQIYMLLSITYKFGQWKNSNHLRRHQNLRTNESSTFYKIEYHEQNLNGDNDE